jgi:outer membrane protein OmpA-like peptidoglycan-associated protein
MASAPVATPTFDIALERFRTFFTHEPVIVYFDTDRDTPGAAEAAKLAEVTSWMALHSDVQLEIDGFADERGSAAHNADLSQRRADVVAALLIGRGVDPARITSASGRGETASFAAGAEAGQLQANRRVRIRFVRTATEMPIA